VLLINLLFLKKNKKMKRRLPSVPRHTQVVDFKRKGPLEDCHEDCHETANLTGKAKNVRVYPNRVYPNTAFLQKNYITKSNKEPANYTNSVFGMGPPPRPGCAKWVVDI
jgi:hypothetical protein